MTKTVDIQFGSVAIFVAAGFIPQTVFCNKEEDVGPLGYPERPQCTAVTPHPEASPVERQRSPRQERVDIDEAIGAKRGTLGIPSGLTITLTHFTSAEFIVRKLDDKRLWC